MQLQGYFQKKNFVPKIEEKPSDKLNLCVVLPSYNETNLERSLLSLSNCIQPSGGVEVIVVINHPANSTSDIVELSEQSLEIVKDFDVRHGTDCFRLYGIKAFDLPRKSAGVGLARQIGMDEAAYRLSLVNNPNGIITCFDADATCMQNYFLELENLWNNYPNTTACSIRYAHPTHGIEYSNDLYAGIAGYELHLRYYNQASRFVGFPFSYHTIGSSMACTAQTYLKFGGMNRHQAGEDFYFLQKIIPHGNFRELNTTCVFPSPRPSTRVPFGTGRAMMKFLENSCEGIKTYNLNSFIDLVPLFLMVDKIWDLNDSAMLEQIKLLPRPISDFLLSSNVVEEIRKVKDNTANQKSFRKRFFLWFDAFMLLKYLNFVNENYYTREQVEKEAAKLGRLIGLPVDTGASIIELLELYRKKDMETWDPKF